MDRIEGLLPTVEGCVEGIVSLDPPTVQCGGCGKTHTERTIALAVILSGMRFQNCDPNPPRLCRDCFVQVADHG